MMKERTAEINTERKNERHKRIHN